MYRAMISILFAILAAGCVNTTTVKLDSDQSNLLQSKSLAISSSDKPNFIATTPLKSAFALIGVAAMIAAGNEIVEKHNIDDPSVFVGTELAKKLANLQQMNLNKALILSENDSIEYLSSLNPNQDYLLDVRTLGWGFSNYHEIRLIPSSDPYFYHVNYGAKARLIDLQTNKVIAEAFCQHAPEQTPESPTYEQLLNNDAAGLKDRLQTAAEFCLADLSKKLL